MSAQQNSVMVALSELQRIESDRVSTERAQEIERRHKDAERRRKEEEERVEAERHRLRVAEAEARLRVAEEVRAADAVQRAQRIEDELRVVKAEKAVLAEQFYAQPSPGQQSDGLGFWRFATAAILVGVGMAGVAIFAWPRRPPPPIVIAARPPLSPVVVEDAEAKKRIDDLERRLQGLISKDPPPASRPAIVRHKPAATVGKPVNISSATVGECDDPLCGLTLKK